MSKSPDDRDERPAAEPLAGRLPQGADALQVAVATVALWESIDQALSPVVGPRGVAALYSRSLRLTVERHAWLGDAGLDVLAPMDLAALRDVLEQQTATEAAAGSADQFKAFHQLLTSLVGAALTERLLRSVWPHSAGDAPVQDTFS